VKRIINLLCIPFFIAQINGQNLPEYGDKPEFKAIQIGSEIIIDGNVKDDEVWNTITPASDLIQSRPQQGEKPSEKTEMRIAYDNENMYISFVCYDSEIQDLVVTDARRDGDLTGTDAVLFIFDTYKDGQNGFIFGTNSVGTQYDAQVDNEGQGNFNQNRQQAGVIGGFNLNWDATWTVATSKDDESWSAEFAIPFRTLRFRTGENVTWGFNVQRNIRKANEIDYWVSMPIDFDIKRLSLAGNLTGLNLKKPGNLQIIPYALGKAEYLEEESAEIDLAANAGVDLKYSVTPSMTLDLTYNTDFAQVEVDEQQVNLDRFNLFFPEKRGFFLENAGLFTVGSPGEVDLFFTRRIGISEDGNQVPIIGGARLSGKINNTNIGLLSMFTEPEESNVDEGTNFSVARVNHEFRGTRSSLGGLFVNKQGLGEDGEFNRTYALDGKFGIGKKAQIIGFYSGTSDELDADGGNSAFKLNGKYEWNGLNITLGYTQVGEAFNPEVGFLSRSAFRKPEFLILYRIRPKESSPFLELRPHVSYRSYWNFNGFRTTNFIHIDNHWEFKNGMEVHTGINLTGEGVEQAFEISEGVTVPANSYNHREAQIVFFTNKSKIVSINTRTVIGGFFGGNRFASNASVNVRYGEKFNFEVGVSHNDINLPDGEFTADLLRSRISYNFTPRIFVQSLIQYNDVTKAWSSNVRFGWLRKANTGLFVVFNDSRGVEFQNNRNFIIKYSYLFDIIK
jgi:hypothetical protein